jgi:TonB family protein
LNRMLSSIPAFRRKASACPFLLAFVLAGSNFLLAAKSISPPQIAELDTEAAAKLLIHVAKPAYPAVAKVNFVQGDVMLRIKVTPTGHVYEAHIVDGEPILAVAALGAVRKWLYRPYHSPQGPAPFLTLVVVKFNLHPHHFRDRLPSNAANYFEKQIRLPEVISRPQQEESPRSIPMKVLVGSKGEVLDATSPNLLGPEVELARKNLRLWKFRPARWGAIAVPWYLTVSVPIERAALNVVANSAKH